MDDITPSEDYRSLYILQDKVLETLFTTESDFYLTGGTCLSRFYQEKRYSDDLDFFTNASPRFAFALRNIIHVFKKSFDTRVVIETKNYVRLAVDESLQIDFVNDIAYRYKEPVVTEQNYLIDNLENILANKLTAVIGRDNPKDIFDILMIYTYYDMSWPDILEAAHKKAGFTDEDLIIRLKSFPKTMLNQIKCIDCSFLDSFETDIAAIIDILLRE
jgi:predicted nucleotidyltransferase component of viral defense system